MREQFPEVVFRKVKLTKGNWDFYVLLVGDKYIFRFPKDKEGRTSLKREIAILKNIEDRISTAIPDYRFIGKDYEFAGYRMIPGGADVNCIAKLGPAGRSRVAGELARFLTEMHSIPLRISRKFGLSFPAKYLPRLKRDAVKYLYPKLFSADIAAIKSFWPEIGRITPPVKTLVHGDMSGDNYLIRGNKLSGVIDFSDMSLNDPAVDFKKFWKFGEDFIKQVYHAYRGPKDINFLYRSKLYYRLVGIQLVLSSLKYRFRPLKFPAAYRFFKKIFYGMSLNS